MTSEETLLEKLKVLPPSLKQKVSNYIDDLQKKAMRKSPRVSLEGIWSNMGVDLTEEDIREARREAWKNFPREDLFNETK